MKRVFVNFFMTLALITLISNNCFSQVNKSEGFTKLVLLKGKVVDKNGHGVPMVMISVYGTTLGGLSRQDGSFEFSVPEDQPFGLLCWHPNYITETFPVNTDNKSNFTITLTEDVNTIDFINKSFVRSQKKIDENLSKPNIKLEFELMPEFLGYNEFPEYPGGENGFWQKSIKEIQNLSVTNRGKSRLTGFYHGTLMIRENGLMELIKVDEPVTETQRKTFQDFFVRFGQWKPVMWRGKPLEKEFNFVIKFD